MKLRLVEGLIASRMLKGSLALGALLSLAVFPEGRASKTKNPLKVPLKVQEKKILLRSLIPKRLRRNGITHIFSAVGKML